jgi:RNA chaperone Hfq
MPRGGYEAEAEPSLLGGLRGRRVTVSLRSGYLVEGILAEISRYEILLDDGKEKHIIFKHAIEYVIPSEGA